MNKFYLSQSLLLNVKTVARLIDFLKSLLNNLALLNNW